MNKKIWVGIIVAVGLLVVLFVLITFHNQEPRFDSSNIEQSIAAMRESIKDENTLEQFEEALDTLGSDRYANHCMRLVMQSGHGNAVKVIKAKSDEEVLRYSWQHLNGLTVDSFIREMKDFQKQQ